MDWTYDDIERDTFDQLKQDCKESEWDEILAKFYHSNRVTRKDWDELSYYEIEQVKRDYELYTQEKEDPEYLYGTRGL
jgi:hypothetical protein